MSDSGTPAGWHPDPGNPSSGLRWWDGTRWTEHTHPVPGSSASPYGQAGYGQAGYSQAGYPQAGYPQAGYSQSGNPPPYSSPSRFAGPPAGSGFWALNRMSAIAVAVGLAYVAIDLLAHFVIFGFVPLLMAVRANRRRERMAPVAIVLAVAVIGLSVYTLAHR